MTVGDLIEILSSLPQQMPVVIGVDHGAFRAQDASTRAMSVRSNAGDTGLPELQYGGEHLVLVIE